MEEENIVNSSYYNNVTASFWKHLNSSVNLVPNNITLNNITPNYGLPLLLMGCAALVGNGLVCVLFVRNRHLRNITNTFVVSLALSDMLVPLVLLPCYRAELKIVPYVIAYILFSSLFNFCAVTYDRYQAILHPLCYRATLTRSKANKIIILAWGAPLVVTLVPVSWEYEATRVKYLADRIYHGSLVLMVIIYSVVIFIVYSRIFKAIRRQVKLVIKQTHSTVSNNDDEQPRLLRQSSFRCQISLISRNLAVEIKAAKVISLLGITFAVCWFPLILINMYYVLGLERFVPPALPHISLFSLVGNSVVDPMIYSFLKSDFRAALMSLIRCRNREKQVQSNGFVKELSKFRETLQSNTDIQESSAPV